MTSWRNVTSLFLLIFSLINLSKEGCLDYLTKSAMSKNDLTRLFPLVKANDSNNVLLCTLYNGCNKINNDELSEVCNLFNDCFPQTNKPDKCEGETHQNTSLYHLMCLTAKAKGSKLYEGCQYENICRLYSEIAVPLSTTTTPLPPKTTRSSPTTTTSIATLSKVIQNHGSGYADNTDKSHSNLLSLLIISMILNVVLPLVVYLCMRQRTHNPTHMPAECHATLTTSADTIQDGCPLEMDCQKEGCFHSTGSKKPTESTQYSLVTGDVF